MIFLTLTALIVEVVVLSALEIRPAFTRTTPFGLLAFPYLAVVLVVFLLGPSLDFVPLNASSLIIWMCGLFLVWLTGQVLMSAVPGLAISRCFSNRFELLFPGEATAAKLSMWFTVALIPFLGLNLLLAVRTAGGWSHLASTEFKSAYAQGWLAHAVIFTEPLFILLIGTAKKKSKLQIIIAGIVLIFFVLGQVKGRVLQPVLGAFLYRLLRQRSFLSFKTVSLVGLSFLLVFMTIYFGTMYLSDAQVLSDPDAYLFVGRHAYYYLTAGVLAHSEAMSAGTTDFGGSSAEVFSPFVNVYRGIFSPRNLITPGSSHGKGMQVDLTADDVEASSNVYTIFGTLYFYLGPLGASLYVIVMGFVCYALLLLAELTRNEWLLVLYCYVGAQLFFGFFEFYFWHLDTYEICVYSIALAGFSPLFTTNALPKQHVSLQTRLLRGSDGASISR